MLFDRSYWLVQLVDSWRQNIKKWYWVYCSFLVPFSFYTWLASAPLAIAIRSGLAGLSVAFLIYVLWKISLRVYGIVLPERYGDLVIGAFAILLWVIWFGVAQVILIACDEVNGSSSESQDLIRPLNSFKRHY